MKKYLAQKKAAGKNPAVIFQSVSIYNFDNLRFALVTSMKCGKRSRNAEWFGELAFAITRR